MTTNKSGGLFAGNQLIPLRVVKIDIKAEGVAASVTVSQRYENIEKVPVEAVYTFPLEESSAVCEFVVELDGKKVVGIIEEKDSAFEKYDQALADGHGAYLLDQDRPNIFTASIGNLLPGKSATIHITYVTELKQVSDSIRLMIPTTVSPRYIPPDQQKNMDLVELDHLTPPVMVGKIPYGLSLTAEIEVANGIRSVECPSHPVKISIVGTTALVELMGSGKNIQLDKDFVLTIISKKPYESTAVVSREEDGTRTVMVNLFPDLSSLERSPCEFIFLLDRSGSMCGTSIEQARNALILCLSSLEKGDYFNIVGFGSHFQKLFKDSVSYTQKSLDKALLHVQGVQADLGGTELMRPLTDILEGNKPGKLPRQILLLTDGQVSNEQACVDLAEKHSVSTRVFTFGIGYGASEYLVRGIARASRGEAEFIQPNERIEPKVLRQFSRIASAHLKNLSVDWGKLDIEKVVPHDIPPLFDGDNITFYGRMTGGGPTEVAITADGPEGPMRFPAWVDTERPRTDKIIPTLFARKAILDLEEGRSSRLKRKVRNEIIELSCRYGLLSSETSFIAVEERDKESEYDDIELRRIPIAITKDWHGIESQSNLTRTQAGTINISASQLVCPNGHPMDPSWDICPCCAQINLDRSAGYGGYQKTQAIDISQFEEEQIAVVGWLVALNGNHKGEDFRLRGGKNVIGTGLDCEVVVVEPYIAGHHAAIRYDNGSFILIDFNSANGSYVNSKGVMKAELSDGDTIRIANIEFRFKDLWGASSGMKSPAASGATSSTKKSSGGLIDLTLLQRADGYFSLTHIFAELVGVSFSKLQNASDILKGDKKTINKAVATLVSIHYIRTNFTDREDEWRLIVKKALKWLDKQKINPPDGSDSLEVWIATVLDI